MPFVRHTLPPVESISVGREMTDQPEWNIVVKGDEQLEKSHVRFVDSENQVQYEIDLSKLQKLVRDWRVRENQPYGMNWDFPANELEAILDE
jgi:hypothetical protein